MEGQETHPAGVAHQSEERLVSAVHTPSFGVMQRLSLPIAGFVGRHQPSEEAVLIATATVVGLLTGAGAVIVIYLIRACQWLFYDWLPRVTAGWPAFYVVAAPAIGGLICGLLIWRFAEEAKGHGVPEVMEAVALRGGRIRPVVASTKALASAICIGSGGSAGREGPMVQIGSTLGSTLGQTMRMSEDRVRNLVACGAAGGIAATFNAPIAGVMFAIEIILGEFSVRHLSSVVVAAVIAAVVGQRFFGPLPAFHIPVQFGVESIAEYPLYVLLALLAAAVGMVYVRTLYGFEGVFERWRVPEWLKPAVGGALLGLLALTYTRYLHIEYEGLMPHIFSVGYTEIAEALAGHTAMYVVAWLLVLKIIATSLTLGSGGSGGVFAPSLFIGAMLGSLFALVAQHFVPTMASPGAYALVGMAAVFGAAAQAPLTAFMILFELTGDYNIILPLMLAVVIATVVGRRLLGGESIYTLKLSRRGVRLQSGRDVDVLASITVEEAMQTNPETVRLDTTIGELSEALDRSRQLSFPVLDDEGKLWGIVAVSDLDRAAQMGLPRNTSLTEIAAHGGALLTARPSETVGSVLGRMGARGIGRMPVVAEDDATRLVGLINRDDVTRAYHVALTQRSQIRGRMERLQTRQQAQAELVDIVLHPGDPGVGRPVREVAPTPPQDWLLVSIRRGERLLIPKGDSVLEAGDVVTVLSRGDDVDAVRSLLRGA